MAAGLPKLLRLVAACGTLAALAAAAGPVPAPWGFYAHREINRQAVFTLPAELAGWYKRHVEYVSAHAVDPDKRRYAAPLEAERHFIDLERFGDGTVGDLPGDFWAFHDRYTDLLCLRGPDSLAVVFEAGRVSVGADTVALPSYAYGAFYRQGVLPAYFQQDRRLDTALAGLLVFDPRFTCTELVVRDTMTAHGILPYHLEAAQRQLTQAFAAGDFARALQLSAELGHYLGDATVPLHTTINYDGQFTGQRGIHAFWESRLPELFAEGEFDGLVGPARYIDDERAYFRRLVAESHARVDSVLLIEAELRRTVPEELQDCYEERLGEVVRVPCRSFARAYFDRLDGMVEERFRAAVHATGSMWYTAWVDGGMPDLPDAGGLGLSVESGELRGGSHQTRGE